MRPRILDEFFGQKHILAPGKLLRRAIEADQISSLIFYGPPGTGKTTLARVIAQSTSRNFMSLNAVLAGVKDIRQSVEEARVQLSTQGKGSILFIDEVHRFNKSQQDALLPHVEAGTLVLIGATTENPYFEVNKALLSRSRIFELRSLERDELKDILLQAIKDNERGFGRYDIHIEEKAEEHWLNTCGGDARTLLGALELAVVTSAKNHSKLKIDLHTAEESIQHKAVLYDKDGDYHYDVISAFIKSVRGSDPDAALYWLARMVDAGEDPRYIFRRLYILASEDIGLADPQAIAVVHACASAYDYVGLPEGQFHLTHATLHLCNAAKSNSTLAYFDALKAVKTEAAAEVPSALKDGNRDGDDFGHGKGYLYPHAYKDHWVAQQYLPDALKGRLFYQPGEMGEEARAAKRLRGLREAQLAILHEESQSTEKSFLSLRDSQSAYLKLRQAMIDMADLERSDSVFVPYADNGFLASALLEKKVDSLYLHFADQEMQTFFMKQKASGFEEIIQTRNESSVQQTIERLKTNGIRFESCFVWRSDKLEKGLIEKLYGLCQEGGLILSALWPNEKSLLSANPQVSYDLSEELLLALQNAEREWLITLGEEEEFAGDRAVQESRSFHFSSTKRMERNTLLLYLSRLNLSDESKNSISSKLAGKELQWHFSYKLLRL